MLANGSSCSAETTALAIDGFGLLAVTAVLAAFATLAPLLASLAPVVVRNGDGVVGIDSEATAFRIGKVVGVVVRIAEAMVRIFDGEDLAGNEA